MNPTSLLPQTVGAISRNLAFAFYLNSVKLFGTYLQIVKVGSAANRYLRWRVGFIEFEVGVDLDVADRGLSLELDVDQVWELPV